MTAKFQSARAPAHNFPPKPRAALCSAKPISADKKRESHYLIIHQDWQIFCAVNYLHTKYLVSTESRKESPDKQVKFFSCECFVLERVCEFYYFLILNII